MFVKSISTMKKLLNTYIFKCFILYIFLYTSCEEYSDKKPLKPISKSYFDKNIVGVWQFEKIINYNSTLNEDSHYILIIPFNNKQYLIMYQSLKQKSKNYPFFYKAHLTKIKTLKFANVQMIIENNQNHYYFYAYEVKNDSLYYWGYSEKKLPEKFNKKKFLTKHYKDTTVISAIRIYKRIENLIPMVPIINDFK